jgi:Pyridoxamine 5'-phosphate oxidase
MLDAPRSRSQRRQDTLARLETDVDLWVATADPDSGTPHLIPLSFYWDGATLLVATPKSSPTGRNLRATGAVRLGIGTTRDVVMVDGTVETITIPELPGDVGDAFAVRTGFEPRTLRTTYLYFRIRPVRVQAWREVNELEGRDLMMDGAWL